MVLDPQSDLPKNGTFHSPMVVKAHDAIRRERLTDDHAYDAVGFKDLVTRALKLSASDIHLCVNESPRFRIRGEIETFNLPPLSEFVFYRWLEEILSPQQIAKFEEEQEYDTAAYFPDLIRCRINLFFSLLGSSMVIRLIPLEAKSMEQLYLPEKLKELCAVPKGLFLITGPTGSGKSTTVAAMIRYMNETFKKNIVSIEDPIEFVHTSKKCTIRQREVGIHTKAFENALRAVLREDPDIILIGEMRDRMTVETALKAAQTGHLVFGTLHTNSAVATINRILNIFQPSEQDPIRHQLSESLVAIAAQMLLPSTDGSRRAVLELYINTVTGRDFIDRGDYDQLTQLIKECDYEGMQTMNDVMFRLVKEGVITPETSIKFSPYPNEMSQLLRGKEDNLIAANREIQDGQPRNSFGSGTQYSGSYSQNPNRPPSARS